MKIIIPQEELENYKNNPSDFSPKHINVSDLNSNEIPMKITFHLSDFELSIAKHNFTILSFGRKYYKLEETVVFGETVLVTESDELIFKGLIFSKTSSNVYDVTYNLKENKEKKIDQMKVVGYYCNCHESKRNKISMCYHLIVGLFKLRNLLRNSHPFDFINEEDEEEKSIDFWEDPNPTDKIYDQKVQQLRERYQCCEEPSVLKELTCQLCLEILSKPVAMACKAHSICEQCLKYFLMIEKNWNNDFGFYQISCPMCGEKTGSLKFKDDKSWKINKEVERLRNSYIEEMEKNELMREKCLKIGENLKKKESQQIIGLKRKIGEIGNGDNLAKEVERNKKVLGVRKLRSQGSVDEIDMTRIKKFKFI